MIFDEKRRDFDEIWQDLMRNNKICHFSWEMTRRGEFYQTNEKTTKHLLTNPGGELGLSNLPITQRTHTLMLPWAMLANFPFDCVWSNHSKHSSIYTYQLGSPCSFKLSPFCFKRNTALQNLGTAVLNFSHNV